MLYHHADANALASLVELLLEFTNGEAHGRDIGQHDECEVALEDALRNVEDVAACTRDDVGHAREDTGFVESEGRNNGPFAGLLKVGGRGGTSIKRFQGGSGYGFDLRRIGLRAQRVGNIVHQSANVHDLG